MKTLKSISSLLLISLLISCNNSTKDEKLVPTDTTEHNDYTIVTKEQFEKSNMQVSSPIVHEFNTGISVHGKTQVPPTDRASLMTYTGGYIESIYKQRGETVKKGEVIATIENPKFIELQKQYIEVSKEFSVLTTELERQTALYEEKISAKKIFERTQANYENIKIEKRSLERELELYGFSSQEVIKGNLRTIAALKAPISGVIEQLNIHLGQYVSSEENIATIINTENIHIELEVFEKDWHAIKKDQKVEFRFPSYSSESYKAEIQFVGKSIDRNTRNVIIQAKIMENIEHLVPGIFVEADIHIHSHKQWALPESAFAQEDSKSYIMKLKEKTDNEYIFTTHPIEIEIEDSGFKSFKNIVQDTSATFLSKGIFTIISLD